MEERARKALRMVQLGELSAGRQALEGAAIAPGNDATLSASQDSERRPPEPREPLPFEIHDYQPDREIQVGSRVV